MDVVERLDKIREEMLRFHKESTSHLINKESEIWVHIMNIESALTTIAWALATEIDPHHGMK